MAEETPENKGLKNEVQGLREKLNELNQKKEEWFKKKEELKAEIATTIARIKDAKGKNDVLNKDISGFKASRDEFNAQVKELIAKIKGLNKKKDCMLAKSKFKGIPSEVKGRINRLEESLETQAFTFDKEKKIMKEINNLKKQYESVKCIYDVQKEINDVSHQITEAKKKGDEFHNKLRERSGSNKESYESFIQLSKDIGKLKKTQEEAFANFIKFKQEYAEASKVLKEKMDAARGVAEVEAGERRQKQRERKYDERKQLKERANVVKEKLRSKKKLTTEDIITMQGIEDTEEF
ncbi:MAG: hypothetical protein QME12_00820 [Nanoarchaeota archaeon]|nr:hypothetical protein [Nanoarchaeota archaeon]